MLFRRMRLTHRVLPQWAFGGFRGAQLAVSLCQYRVLTFYPEPIYCMK